MLMNHARKTLTALSALLLVFCCADASAGNAAAGDTELQSEQEFAVRPRIFNGTPTSDYLPTAAYLVTRRSNPRLNLACSAILVGPSTALTAGHCVCDTDGFDCQPGAIFEPDPSTSRLFLQHAGIARVESISVPETLCDPTFSSTCDLYQADYAVLNLGEVVPGIQPAALAFQAPALGTPLDIVGFGNDGEAGSSHGVKRQGTVTTVDCEESTAALAADEFVCWRLANAAGENTCPGDSGGPAYLLNTNADNALVVAGVTVGGDPSCDLPGDVSFDTDVALVRDDVIARSEGEITTVAAGPDTLDRIVSMDDTFTALGDSNHVVTVDVPQGTTRVLVTSNGTDPLSNNQYVVSLRRGAQPTSSLFDCRSGEVGTFQACTVSTPDPGTWFARIQRTRGTGGDFQFTVTTFRSAQGGLLDPRIRVKLEEPEANQTKTGVANLRGWAVGPAGISRVELFIDGKLELSIPYGGRRGDVARAFPDFPDSDQSGYSQAFNYSNLPAGLHEFTARASAADGSFNEVSTTFTVIRFPSPFIKDPNQVSLSRAQAVIQGETLRLLGVTVEGVSYDLDLQWRTATQNLGITEIEER